MMREDFARHVAFVLRCSGAATFAYLLAGAVGLPHPVWAAMSGVIVSQQSFAETRSAMGGRLLGTVIGIGVAIAVGLSMAPLGASIAVQMAVAVALCAIVARRHVALRVCMWTCPIVFLTASPATPIEIAGLYRGAEVILGAAVGGALHLAAEALLNQAFRPTV
jgi:uncharacterized membrane protein YgaE (UPF0421/DUF939 family)